MLGDPFSIPYPTAVQTSLRAQASFARFDPSGRFIAAGRPDGSACIWDLDTRTTVRWLEGHVKGITSVECVTFLFSFNKKSFWSELNWDRACSWSRNSRYVLTSSKDWNVIVWDLASETDPPKRVSTIRFDAPVTSASFHPRNRSVSFPFPFP